jgi:hypothetical protein
VANSLASSRFGNHQRANLGQVFPHGVQGASTNQLAFGIYSHGELLNFFVQGYQIVMKQYASFF